MKIFFLIILYCFLFGTGQSQTIDSSDIYFHKGLDEKKARLFLPAYDDFQKSLLFQPNQLEAEIQLGLMAFELRKYDVAIQAFLKVNAAKKNDTTAIRHLAIMYFWTHQWAEAIKYASIANQIIPGHEWNYMLGKSYYQQEDYQQAFTYLQAASREDTANAELPYLIARGFVDMNNYKSAIHFYHRAIYLDSSKVQWIYECALVYATVADDQSAIQYYQLAAAKGYKTDNDYYENLSDSYLAAGQPEKGLQLMLKVLEKKPADPQLLYSIAHAYYKLGKYQQAIDYWERILSMDKDNAQALYMIGMAYQKKGDAVKGKQLCDKAILLDPSLKGLKTENKIDM